MYDARAIANFFLDRAEQGRVPITIMTLLKVLYFAHAWYLVKFEKPLVAQPFEAWNYGPVSRVVYDQFKEYGRKPVDRKAVSFDPQGMEFVPTRASFNQDTEVFLENIFDYYAKFHPFELSHLTHEKGGPWDIIWTQAGKGAVPGMIIPNILISTWFKTQEAVYWTNQERSRST